MQQITTHLVGQNLFIILFPWVGSLGMVTRSFAQSLIGWIQGVSQIEFFSGAQGLLPGSLGCCQNSGSYSCRTEISIFLLSGI